MNEINEPFEATGGARVGWTNATWPFARLTATSTSLRVAIRVLGDYSFTPDTVVSITRFTTIPVLGWGIRIQHCVPDYPAAFIFWCLGSPDALLQGIRDAGFLPQAPASAVPPRRGFAFRWPVILVALVIWNGLVLSDLLRGGSMPPVPGPGSLLAIGLLLTTVIATLRLPAFQQLVLKPGRSVGEIRPTLNLLLLISGFMFVVLLLVIIFR
jgi:hypothetical protein